jgi:hypothetical protein
MDEPQVALDHLPLGSEITTLDALGERDLLGGREQAIVVPRHLTPPPPAPDAARRRAPRRPDELVERGRRGLIAPEQRELDAANRWMLRAAAPPIATSGAVVSTRASPAATAASIAGPGPPRSSAAVTPSAPSVSATSRS